MHGPVHLTGTNHRLSSPRTSEANLSVPPAGVCCAKLLPVSYSAFAPRVTARTCCACWGWNCLHFGVADCHALTIVRTSQKGKCTFTLS